MRGNPYYFTQSTTITFRYQKTMMSKKLLRVTQLINNFVRLDIITLLMFLQSNIHVHASKTFENLIVYSDKDILT